MRPRLASTAIITLAAPALGQQIQHAAVPRCTPEGGSVVVGFAGFSHDTCIPLGSRVTVNGDRIDFEVDWRLPPNTPCGDLPTAWCFEGVTGPLPDGVYRFFTTILPRGPVERDPIVVNCRQPALCTPAPLAEGTNEMVLAMTTWDPDGAGPEQELLVVGGSFNRAGSIAANGVAAWDGKNWRTLGQGVEPGTVLCLGVFRDELIAGGYFTSAGGEPALNIASWDGVRWRALGDGIGGESSLSTVETLIVFRDGLIAGGSFRSAGATPAMRVARWDGTQWHALGDGVGNPLRSRVVRSLAVHENELVVGGWFETAGAGAAHNIARWDGAEWRRMDAGAEAFQSINRLVTHEGVLIASATKYVQQEYSGSVLEWDSGAWRARDAGLPTRPIGALSVYRDRLVAAPGGFGGPDWCLPGGIHQWDGARWRLIAESDGTTFDLAVFNDQLVTGGQFQRIGSHAASNIASLDCMLPACAPDFDASGAVDSADFLAFLDAFFDEHVSADVNFDLRVNSQDFFDFVATFFAGC